MAALLLIQMGPSLLSKNKRVEDLGSLGIRMPEGLKSVEEVPEWEEIDMVVDSGASC